ncbi:hypothetical protein AB0D10_05240 [Kitasatospora sp. NPDC048545]|uniref:hypothetical protein n=1 Tax=Kitasatospora sp. NPDC048545 TaxID=3157208 RepID=UPI0033C9CC13
MSVARYPTAGNPSKNTVVYQDHRNGVSYAWWGCDNCGTSVQTRNLAHSDDRASVNDLRREAKAHADDCVI